MHSLYIKLPNGIEYSTETNTVVGDIEIPAIGTVDENGITKPYEILVKVDGEDNNRSFSIESFTKWCSYRIERYEGQSKSVIGENEQLKPRLSINQPQDGMHEVVTYPQNSYVKILLFAGKNLNTTSKWDVLTITHNCVPLSIFLNITQAPTKYTLTVVNKDKIPKFKMFPENLFEEVKVDVVAEGGTCKWYVKEIAKYQVNGDNLLSVPYDNVFKYRIENNQLIVRSYGYVDLSTAKTKYQFTLCHKDINNENTPNEGDYEETVDFWFDEDGNKDDRKSFVN